MKGWKNDQSHCPNRNREHHSPRTGTISATRPSSAHRYATQWKTAPRDSFIGWSPEVRERSLQRLVGNSRYLTMLWVRIPYLASHIFSEARRRLPRDWHDRYGVTPLLMETFVEVPRFTGAVYKVSG